MENTKPNDTAFPVDSQTHTDAGLSKREYFAAMAMQGLLANSNWMKEYRGERYKMEAIIVAEVSIKQADALINSLNTTP